MKLELLGVAALSVAFGSVALYLGYDGVVISTVFGILGAIAGYLYGHETKKEAPDQG